jgi:hypothetical protein
VSRAVTSKETFSLLGSTLLRRSDWAVNQSISDPKNTQTSTVHRLAIRRGKIAALNRPRLGIFFFTRFNQSMDGRSLSIFLDRKSID